MCKLQTSVILLEAEAVIIVHHKRVQELNPGSRRAPGLTRPQLSAAGQPEQRGKGQSAAGRRRCPGAQQTCTVLQILEFRSQNPIIRMI